MQAIGRARKIENATEHHEYPRRTVDSMSNVEIKNKLCRDVRGGCKRCPVLGTCRYGQEAEKRGLLK